MIRYRRWVFYFCLAFLILSATTVGAETSCVSCHKGARPQALKGRHVHQPLQQGKCGQCHVAGNKVAVRQKKSPLATEKQQQANIRWIKTLSDRQQEHWLRLPEKAVSGSLYLKAAAGRLRTPVTKVVLPALKTLPQQQNDNQPPQQSGITVSDVRRSISASATLRWTTDKFTESLIYYGVGQLSSLQRDQRLAREHAPVLVGLDAGETYQYQIVSRDLFGNETKSPVMTFSTEKSFLTQVARNDLSSPFATEIELDWQAYRVDKDYLLAVTADRPVSLSFGVEKNPVSQQQSKPEVKTAGSFSHPILKSSFDTNVTICRNCHLAIKEDYSHPINIRAKSGMIIPEEYALLPDGKMSCMTCHDNHASDHEYRLRKSRKADLCRGCHRNY